MTDVIGRKVTLKHIEEIRQGVQMMDDIRRASIIMNGMYLCEEAVRNQPSAQPLVLTCDGCRHFGTYDTDFPCSGCIRREKDCYEQER